MDNDILIDQARHLYAILEAKQIGILSPERLDRLSTRAYRRYQRRLNRCVLCYQTRNHDCIREPGEKLIPCAQRLRIPAQRWHQIQAKAATDPVKVATL